jgi:hypothetical protein
MLLLFCTNSDTVVTVDNKHKQKKEQTWIQTS